MKKFSTAALVLALASIFLPITSHAAADESRVDPDSVKCTFRQDAPDQHVVVKGDTLWGISGQFLEHAWCWPQVWGLNRDEIKNPHWIYPGQIVYFDRATGRLRLGTPISSGGTSGPASDNRVEPQTRTQQLGSRAISSIPANLIEPYLSKPLIVNEKDFASMPHIVAMPEGHVNAGKGEKAYIRGDLKGETAFQVFRPGKPLKDPATNQVLGNEAIYLGTGRIISAAKTADSASTLEITEAKEEMSVGDRLVPVPLTPFINYVPHSPAGPLSARVMSIYEGVNNAGQNQIVTINRGKNDGVDIGTVLQLYTLGATIKDATDNNKSVKLPDEEYGSLFVFRVFDRVSYALIMEVRDSVQVGDVAKTPE